MASVGNILINSLTTPARAYYEGIDKNGQEIIEEALDRHNVSSFRGFNYWMFHKTDNDIMIRRLTWEIPSHAEDPSGVAKFLDRYYSKD